jgi:2-iminobutanoate/2-iminopropanoate deaminase
MKEVIKSDKAPAAIGPYSQAIKVPCGIVMFLSGIIPLDPTTMQVVGQTAAEQCTQIINNMKEVLRAGGADLSNVVKTTIFLADLSDFGAVNEVYAAYFDSNPPARSTIEVSRLPMDVKVKIEATAFLS